MILLRKQLPNLKCLANPVSDGFNYIKINV